ncbi:hypothetical protein C2S51_007783 [Perilla frutescens var. frutescens]|nr:hypothetical protein C2S51_007783 [Perilla frutescens var. frutescens]
MDMNLWAMLISSFKIFIRELLSILLILCPTLAYLKVHVFVPLVLSQLLFDHRIGTALSRLFLVSATEMVFLERHGVSFSSVNCCYLHYQFGSHFLEIARFTAGHRCIGS